MSVQPLPLPMYGDRPVVLLTNDDGPPSASSPNIFAFCKLLQERLGWIVKVVIPDCQKSWVGKAYAISDIITLSYFYPLGPDGLTGDITPTPRPLKEGETMEWILLAGTPASCTNIALHNLYPGQIDMVISGPNHGRNSSTAFALSSGTLGAALAGALSVPLPGPTPSELSLHVEHIPCIAVSYGVVARPVPPKALEYSHDVAVDVCDRLWRNWGYEGEPGPSRRRVQIYSINVPIVEEALEPQNRKVVWTTMWRNAYGQLFKTTKLDKAAYDPSDNAKQDPNRPAKAVPPRVSTTATAGPGALPTPDPASPAETGSSRQLKFHFAPTMGPLLFPPEEIVPEGTDAWAFAKGYVSVTPMRAEYAGLGAGGCGFGSEESGMVPGSEWKM
ncbi:survival protein sure-like phosphatase/nucleotidase [Naematelia encephala]|uniref:Survival protein sure-like phosphatase/nucleotidase n=1 Tax=Naematelia encephala TaxID=71784 RepID=A0A1Y2BD98_9TREE|nr:survival protein sure-like phosphatase/nucleotidase [Naematelia encephala]